jgi:hypothetical protein
MKVGCESLHLFEHDQVVGTLDYAIRIDTPPLPKDDGNESNRVRNNTARRRIEKQ